MIYGAVVLFLDDQVHSQTIPDRATELNDTYSQINQLRCFDSANKGIYRPTSIYLSEAHGNKYPYDIGIIWKE